MADEEILHGGVANAGAVVRVGEHVLRPAPPNAPTIHALLRHLRARGFRGAPDPIGLETDGRERLEFIPGDVPTAPFPAWSQTDAALASTARLLRELHDASAGFAPGDAADWSSELADPAPGAGDVIGHNDVCPENVVFQNGRAVAFLDFDFAAPARRVHDLAAFARMWVPIETQQDAAATGRAGLDPFARLRVVADAYGLALDRAELVDVLDEQIDSSRAFVLRHVEAGEEAFIRLWHELGGAARHERRRRWFDENRRRFLDVLG